MKEKKQKTSQPITIKANKKGRHIMPMISFIRYVALPFYYLLKPFRFYGPRKVKDGACLYICNHFTLCDPAYVIATTPEGIHFIAKKETFETPVLSWLMRSVRAIKANRDGKDVRTVLDSLKCLKNNEKVAIYPEGTRNKSGEGFLPFHSGATALAIRAKVPIVLIVMYSKPKFFKCTHILTDEPFELSEYYDRKLTDEDYEKIDEQLYQRMVALRENHTKYLQEKKRK